MTSVTRNYERWKKRRYRVTHASTPAKVCPDCRALCVSEHGLKVHRGKMHRVEQPSTCRGT